jgi:cyclopropane fatty-acyl-phospholipid synthase-like methyltransferase
MNKKDLLFYDAYQEFYKMADINHTFKEYCNKAFGADFSQDGFSDLHQINVILNMVELNNNSCVLDVGCGNGKMLQYIQEKTGAKIYGFDYSEEDRISHKTNRK